MGIAFLPAQFPSQIWSYLVNINVNATFGLIRFNEESFDGIDVLRTMFSLKALQMIRKLLLSALCTACFSATAFSGEAQAQGQADQKYCGKLAQIGASAFRTRADGYPMDRVLNEVKTILQSKPDTLEDAQEAIVSIYGDRSVSSPQQAYAKVYDHCRQ
jgi:hypothetical protein